MDITPHVNLLRSLRGERTNYVALIGEGVDNAFDAGATSVSVTITDDEVAFKDDGEGITRDRIEAVFSLGDHGAMTTTQLGRFGVGIKSQAVNAGDVMSVISTSRDGKVLASVNWRHVLQSGYWKIDTPRWAPIIVGHGTGTTIIISELRHKPKISLERVRQDIAQRFYPAVAGGKSISLNGGLIETLPEPLLSDTIEQSFTWEDGRSATIRGGILAEPSKLNRVHVAYRHRVIMPGSPLGCGEYVGLTKMFARLQLSGPWHLAKFKDDLTDEGERDELEEVVSAALEPILVKCSAASMSAKISKLAALVNDMIPPELSPARPKHLGGSNKPKRSRAAGEVESEKSTPDGPAKAKRPPQDRLLITFEGNDEEDGIGAFQPGGGTKTPHRVDLSRDNPFVAELIAHRDEEFGAKVLLAFALMLFEEGRQKATAQGEFAFHPFGVRIAKQIAIQEPAIVAGSIA